MAVEILENENLQQKKDLIYTGFIFWHILLKYEAIDEEDKN